MTVGNDNYFYSLNRNGMLRPIMGNDIMLDYEKKIKQTASKAEEAARTILDDLKSNASMLPFLESGNLPRLSVAVSQLEKLCGIVGESLSNASNCQDYLTLSHSDTQFASSASLTDLENTYRILDGSGSYDLPDSRERIVENALRGDLAPDEETLRFLDDLEGGSGSEQLEDLWRMWQYRNNPGSYEGSWREDIGSERYIEKLETHVFGSQLWGQDLSQGAYSYGDSLEQDLKSLAFAILEDLRGSVNDEYIIYENREHILTVAEQLEKWTPYPKSGFEYYLKRWRRLEDFQNEVIEFDTSGEVRAKMVWDNGKNVLYIEADVFFKQWGVDGAISRPMAPSANSFNYEAYLTEKSKYDADQNNEFEKRVAQAMTDFVLWAGKYTVFDGQELAVKVKLNRVYSSSNAAVVVIGDVSVDGVRSFATGQILPQPFGWNPDKSKYMGLLSSFFEEDQYGNIINHKSLAAHEFGHWLGLQDAYHISNDWMPIEALRFPLTEIDPQQYPGYDPNTVMSFTRDIGNVTFNEKEIEMIVLAFQTGKRQSYRPQFPWERKSDAWQ